MTEQITEPIQWVDESVSGEQTFKQLSANRKVQWNVSFQYVEATETFPGLSGFTALQSFFETTTNHSEKSFSLTNKDGVSITCRLVPGSFQFRKGEGNVQDIYYFGSFSVLKVI